MHRDYTITYSVSSEAKFYGKTTMATELCAGLCPPMMNYIHPIETAAISAVVSEKGIRHSLDSELSGCRLSGVNLYGHNVSGGIFGPYSGCFEYDLHQRRVEFRSLSADLAYDRMNVSVLCSTPGTYGAPREAVMLAYDGGRAAAWIRRDRSDFWGGGAEEAVAAVYLTSSSFEECELGSKLGYTMADTSNQYSLWYCAGITSTDTILPVRDPACSAWKNSDCTVNRVNVRVPIEKSFPKGSNAKIAVGTCQPELSGTLGFRWWGWFYAADENIISNGRTSPVEPPGEWRPFYSDNYALSSRGDPAYYSTSAMIVLSSDLLTIGLGPGDNGAAIDPYGNWRGAAEISVFYDRVTYYAD